MMKRKDARSKQQSKYSIQAKEWYDDDDEIDAHF